LKILKKVKYFYLTPTLSLKRGSKKALSLEKKTLSSRRNPI